MLSSKLFKSKCATTVILAVILIAVYLLIAQPYKISGDCMEPKIKDGQLCFLNRIPSFLKKYRINDIILYKHESKVWISRIVALGSNTVQITNGNIIVNDIPLKNMGIIRNWDNWKFGIYAIDKPIKIPTDHVFVLSDKLSAHHDDSRVFGPIPTNSILGVVW